MREFPVFMALFLLLAAGGFALSATDPKPEQPVDSGGALLFRIHCQNCHGKTGAGDGPMAKLLTVQPADLATIARRNGGEFPSEAVRQAIDGRTEIRVHGMREMPVWGMTLRESGRDSAQEEGIRTRIDDLVEYLKALQK